MLKVRGYVFSRVFMGERVPQSIQNLAIRQYCNNNNLDFNLHAVEYSMKDSYFVLESCIDELKNFDGIVFYSLFQLPFKNELRFFYCDKVISLKKKLYFALENLEISNKKSFNDIDIMWKIKKTIPHCSSGDELKTY
tara:strand:+ start:258 stop:668 length:411 start_codon:yes stop_codon:yes gene_type:complete